MVRGRHCSSSFKGKGLSAACWRGEAGGGIRVDEVAIPVYVQVYDGNEPEALESITDRLVLTTKGASPYRLRGP